MPIKRKDVSDIDGIVLSYSRVRSYFDCPLAYKYHYVDKLPEEPAIPLMLGSLTHAILEKVVQHEIDDKDYVCPSIQELAISLWEEILSSNDPNCTVDPQKLEEAFQMAVTLSKLYLDDPDRPNIRAVETHYITENPVYVTDMAKYYLQGYIDGEIKVKPDYAHILDYKTSKNKWGEYDGANEFQPNFYGLLLDVDEIEMTYPILLKHKTPKIQYITTIRDKHQIHAAQKLIQIFVQSTEQQMYYPKRGGWKCNPNYCSFYDKCMEW